MDSRQCFPQLFASRDPHIQTLLGEAQEVTLPADQLVFHRGAPCERYVLVAAGRIKVVLVAPNGREIVLYHVGPGDSCVLTTVGLLGNENYPADGITESPVTALLIGRNGFATALGESQHFRNFVFGNMGRRLADVIARMEQINFSDINSRLAAILLAQADDNGRLSITHQQLALEIGSAREVVSRHLKSFESRGWIRLERGRLEIRDRRQLQSLIKSV
ncbi:MAG: Crp/Fnr family transcriptional regulator [Gammaproteobacteria bacterium]|nr:Crp/Fnr family transcriptional regulator [Gammaproteobacteria bacterium]